MFIPQTKSTILFTGVVLCGLPVSPNMGDYSTMFGMMFQVAGVVGRAETLSALFFLLSLFCYRRAAHDNKGSKNEHLSHVSVCVC